MVRPFQILLYLTAISLAVGIAPTAVSEEKPEITNVGFVLYTKSHAPGTQVEEAVEEGLDPDDDSSTPEVDASDPLDTDRINSGPPADDRVIGERIDSTLQDDLPPHVDDEPEQVEAAEDR